MPKYVCVCEGCEWAVKGRVKGSMPRGIWAVKGVKGKTRAYARAIRESIYRWQKKSLAYTCALHALHTLHKSRMTRITDVKGKLYEGSHPSRAKDTE